MLNSNTPPSENDSTSSIENEKPSRPDESLVIADTDDMKVRGDSPGDGDDGSPQPSHHASSAILEGLRDDAKTKGSLTSPMHPTSQPKSDERSALDAVEFTLDRSIEGDGDTDVESPSLCFQAEWAAAMEALKSRDREVLQRRIGLRTGAVETLASIGNDLKVTRERVRQLEKLAHRRIFIDTQGRREDGLGERLLLQIEQSVADNDGQPLSLRQIARINPWFAGTDRRTLAHTLDLMRPQRWCLVDVDDEVYLCDIPLKQWTKCLNRGRELLRLSSFHRKESQLRVIDPEVGIRRSVLRKQLNALLPSGTECAWVDLILKAVTRKAVFAEDGSGDPLLISAWRSGEAHIMRLLVESERPIHHHEAKELLYRRYRVDIDPRRAHNALSGCGLLFGRGTYGLKKHFPLPHHLAVSMVQDVEELAHREPFAGRQWHCSEMLQALGESAYELSGELSGALSGVDEYILHVALQLHNQRLDSLGRLMWIAGSGSLTRDTARRVPILSTAEQVLQEHGEPMSNSRLRKAVRERRGLGKNFALHPRGRLVRTERGRWGLIDRDVPLDATQMEAFVDAVMKRIDEDARPIEEKDLPAIAFEVCGLKDIDPVMLTSLLQRAKKATFNRQGKMRRIEAEEVEEG